MNKRISRTTKAGKKKNHWKEHTKLDIFKRIDMQGGDPTKCWLYNGYCPPLHTDGQVKIGGIRYYVRRLVYSLYSGIPYDQLPYLVEGCGTHRCVNPTHTVDRKGSKLS